MLSTGVQETLAKTARAAAREQFASNQTERDKRRMREMFAIMHNLDFHDLDGAGVLSSPNEDWMRFNDDAGRFVLGLDTERLGKLHALIESRMPEYLKAGVRRG